MSAQPRALAGQPDRINYRCNSRGRFDFKCSSRLVQANNLEPAVDAELRRSLTDAATLRELMLEAEASREPDPKLADLREREASFVAAFGRGDLTPDEFSLLRRQVRAEMQALQRPEFSAELPHDSYREAAETMSLEKLADFTKLTVIVFPDGFKLLLG